MHLCAFGRSCTRSKVNVEFKINKYWLCANSHTALYQPLFLYMYILQTQKVAKFTEAKDFDAAIKQRGKDFDKDYDFHKFINGTDVRHHEGRDPEVCEKSDN